MLTPEPALVPVRVEAAAAPRRRLACAIEAGMRAPFVDRWNLATDEPAVQGGDGEAPPPLVMLAGALASCLSVQIRSFARRLGRDLPECSVEVAIEWDAVVDGRIYGARAKGLRAVVRLATGEPAEDWLDLVRSAVRGCFVEALLDPGLDIVHVVRTRAGEATT